MALTIYLTREEVPEGMQIIDCNDSYFDLYTALDSGSFCKEVLHEIDKATYTSELMFLGRNEKIGNVNKRYLSTGTKTLLNVYNHTDKVFNTIECGSNVFEILISMNRGNVIWEYPFTVLEDDIECDIDINNKHFSSAYEFLDYIDEIYGCSEDDDADD